MASLVSTRRRSSGILGASPLSARWLALAFVDSTGRFSAFSGGLTINALDTVAFQAPQDVGPTVVATANAAAVSDIVTADETRFRDVQRPAINPFGVVAFQGITPADIYGVFTGPDPIADKVVATGDILDGDAVQTVDFFRGLNDKGQIAVVVHFLTHSALYRADPVK